MLYTLRHIPILLMLLLLELFKIAFTKIPSENSIEGLFFNEICMFVVSMNQCAIYCFYESFFFSIPKFIGVFSSSLQWVWFKQKGVVTFSEPSFKKFTYALAEYKF